VREGEGYVQACVGRWREEGVGGNVREAFKEREREG
jgi:hypothetical protein